MLKKIMAATALLIATNALANTDITIEGLANSADTKASFTKIIKDNHLPSWILKGATETPSKVVTLDDTQYQIITGCKPHNCLSEQIAVIYSKDKNVMGGVFSKIDEKQNKQNLTWFNINDDLSIDGKTVLFAALTGSLDNHPNEFNYK